MPVDVMGVVSLQSRAHSIEAIVAGKDTGADAQVAIGESSSIFSRSLWYFFSEALIGSV